MSIKTAGVKLARIIQQIGVFMLAILAAAMLIYTILTLIGVAPWAYLPMQDGGEIVFDSGPIIQVGLTVILIVFCAMIPSNQRILQLEQVKAKYYLSFNDAVRALQVAFDADRDGLFKFHDAYEGVTERIGLLREVPELKQMSDAHIAYVAKLSFAARGLMKKYSKKKVRAAEQCLDHRNTDCDKIDKIIAKVRPIILELAEREKNIIDRETTQEDEIRELIHTLDRILSSKADRAHTLDTVSAKVVPLGKKAEE